MLCLTLVLVVAVDQASKAWAVAVLGGGRTIAILGSFLNLQLTRNGGGAFGILQNSTLLFVGTTVVIVAGVLLWGLRSGRAPIPLGLVAGGGIGNLVDRVVRAPRGLQGHVVDFIHCRFWPTFNAADSAIVIGVCLLLLLELRRTTS